MFDDAKQKALKITEALYRTTDLFFDGEPLKWELRKQALEVLDSVSNLEQNSFGRVKEIERLETIIKSLLLKIELASVGTFISRANFDVLKREYTTLIGHIMSYKDSYQDILDNILSDKKLLIPAKSRPEVKAADNEHVEVQDRPMSKLSVSDTKTVNTVNMLSQVPIQITDGDRKSKIIITLKGIGSSSVGELAKHLVVSGLFVSEKTVQRELASLVSAGLIKQEGEKRWRRYFVASE